MRLIGVSRLEQIWKKGSKSMKKVYRKNVSKLEKDYRNDLLKHRPEMHDAIDLPGHGELLFPQEEVPDEHRINPR